MRKALCLLFLILLGFLGNYFSLPMFHEINFVFGSILVLLVLRTYGLWWGLLSSLIASAYTLVLWNHPYGLIIFTLETLFIGLRLEKQKNKNLLTASAQYWYGLAPLLVFIFYFLVLKIGGQLTVLMYLKLTINGIFNALIASIILQYLPKPILTDKIQYRRSVANVIFILVVAVVMLPVFVKTFFYGAMYLKEIEAIREHLIHDFIFELSFSWFFLGLAILGAWILSHNLVKPLLTLSRITTDLANNQGKIPSISWPKSRIKEVRQVTQNITALVNRWNQYIHELEEARADYKYLANHDPLTKLPNRAYFEQLLTKKIASSNGKKEQFWVYFIDMDSLKPINDSLGHAAGDSILIDVAKRINEIIGKNDVLARYGGDEFVLLVSSFTDLEPVKELAEQIRYILQKPFSVVNQELTLSSSIGLCSYPKDGQDVGSLIKNADLAMYEAKTAGKNQIRVYDKEMSLKVSRRLYLENSLPRALASGEIFLHYQPQIDIKTKEIYGVEALARWNHPYLGMISPIEFIQYAEESGFIVELGEWILAEACLQAKKWQQAGFSDFIMAVNVSRRQINHPGFVDMVKDTLTTIGLEPSRLELEITESMIMDNIQVANNIFQELEEFGVKVAIDDFGTGYSSLECLRRLPLHTMKLDKSFVQDMENDMDDVIIKALIDLAHNLGLSVIVEGVETIQQSTFLQDNGCRIMQGYLFAKPMPASEFSNFLSKG